METARIFINGRSQAVRLPKAFRFEDNEVFITKVDDMVILYPRRKGWDLLRKGIERFTGDFMADRGQPAAPEDRANW
ncbi:MAG: antitoxin [Planctomycetota bacterium]|nr:MAG: antitoxin [Planctomycetota bacterium]